MGFSGNFTSVSLVDDPAVGRVLLVQGRSDVSGVAADLPTEIQVVVMHNGETLMEHAPRPDLADWNVTFPDGDPPSFTEGDDVFVVGIAKRPAPHDPFVWEGSFALAVRGGL
jgi:hypothetical protein